MNIKALLSIPYIYNFFQNIIGAQKFRKFFAENFVIAKPESKILDIGCGTSEILDFLPSECIYEGYDLSKKYISAATKKYGNRGNWHCSSISKIKLKNKGSFDIAIASGILHHINDEEVISLAKIVKNALNSSGRFVCVENAFTESQSTISKFIISMDRGKYIRSPEGYKTLLLNHFKHVNFTIHHNLIRVPYTHVVFEAYN